jgi:hypothetical protein
LRGTVQVKFMPIGVVCHNTLSQALARGFTDTARRAAAGLTACAAR